MTHDSLTFGLAIVGFGMQAADAARRSRGRRSAAWTRATAAVVGAHVACVWAFRFGWSFDAILRLPVLAIAGAAVWTICRRQRRPVTR